MKNAISWFEIPAHDLERAAKFYEAIFGITLDKMEMMDFVMYTFRLEDPMNGVGGAVVKTSEFNKPAAGGAGVLVYLNGNPNLQTILDKVEAAGGKVLMPKTQISPEYGSMGVFEDTEGNHIGLHNM